jgi:hypothetical protein
MMKNKAKTKIVAIGFLGPSILTFVLILLFDYADIRIFEYLTVSILNKYMVGVNIAHYSPYPHFFSAAFLVSIALTPILIFHWWKIADAKNPQGLFHVFSPLKGMLFLLIAALLPIGLWSIPVDADTLKNTGRYSLVNIYSNSFLFYLMFLMPISFWSSLTAAYIKTLRELRIKN